MDIDRPIIISAFLGTFFGAAAVTADVFIHLGEDMMLFLAMAGGYFAVALYLFFHNVSTETDAELVKSETLMMLTIGPILAFLQLPLVQFVGKLAANFGVADPRIAIGEVWLVSASFLVRIIIRVWRQHKMTA
ncbi:MAG TPA: hypothetical protein VN420_05225 [Candidatus Fimivivens sp.]|nr:hypothetical protein [Candidatus Fimivivens sp.]